jgi:predicted RNA-binding Zn-ribbon protein involved in translation (DUF1610 family)
MESQGATAMPDPACTHNRDPSGLSVTLASAKGSHVADQETPPAAEESSACPDCGTEMVIISIKPILFVSEFEELTLACQKCGSTKILKIKRS